MKLSIYLPFLLLSPNQCLSDDNQGPLKSQEGKRGQTRADTLGQRWVQGIAMHGPCLHSDAFSRFNCVNPDAPKGGTLELAIVGSFTTLNPFNLGESASLGNFWDPRHMGYLMIRSPEEPFSLYTFVAEKVKMAPDRSWITFHIHPRAVFHDGSSVTAQDVRATFEFLAENGLPLHKKIKDKVRAVSVLGSLTVRFDFVPEEGGGFDQELPLIMAMMMVLSERDIKSRVEDGVYKDQPSRPLMGCGPYKVQKVEIGKRLVFEKQKQYWGKGLPIFKGQLNVDKIGYTWFLSEEVAFEAFKKGDIHYWPDKNSVRWEKMYNFPAMKEKKVLKRSIMSSGPVGMHCFAMNSDSPYFQNSSVRKALVLFFDFSALQFILGPKVRPTLSFFENTEFAAIQEPTSEEKKIIERLPEKLKWEKVSPFLPTLRRKKALGLLKEAGWVLKGNALTNQTGKPFKFTLLVKDHQEGLLGQNLARQFKKLGIQIDVKAVDSTIYAKRIKDQDYDMVVASWSHSLAPGVEQKAYWHSSFAGKIGRNHCNIKSKNVDFLCENLLTAHTRQDLIHYIKVLDRALQAGYYVIPLGHFPFINFAYWEQIGIPEIQEPSPYFPPLNAFWIKR